MSLMNKDLPLADPSRIEMAERIFAEYLTISPEEWVTKHGNELYCSSFDQYRYPNRVLHDWIHRLHAILPAPGVVKGL